MQLRLAARTNVGANCREQSAELCAYWRERRQNAPVNMCGGVAYSRVVDDQHIIFSLTARLRPSPAPSAWANANDLIRTQQDRTAAYT